MTVLIQKTIRLKDYKTKIFSKNSKDYKTNSKDYKTNSKDYKTKIFSNKPCVSLGSCSDQKAVKSCPKLISYHKLS